MCGRTACTLQPDRLQLACSHATGHQKQKQKDSKYQKTRWVDHPGAKKYYPSPNVAPTSMLPVLIHGTNIDCPDNQQVLMPMRWGLIPFFHKGDVSEMKLTTFNARSEEFLTKSMFSKPFKQGQRCAIVCDGYYEWKKDGTSKKPYFFYAAQDSKWDICTDVNNLSEEELWSEADGWKGPKLTMMAGIFDCRKGATEDETLYSFTILTQASSPRLAWVHHRMPVFLRTQEEVESWIAPNEGSDKTVLELIKPEDSLVWHPVSPDINNVRNKEVTYAPVDDAKPSAAANFMASWLGKGVKRPTEEEGDTKKLKEETKEVSVKDETCKEDTTAKDDEAAT